MKMELRCPVNLISGVISLICAVVLLVMIPAHIPDAVISSDVQIDQRFLPRMAVIGIGITGIILIIQSLIFKKEKSITVNLTDEARVLLYYLLAVALVLLMRYIGFLFSAVLIVVFSLAFFKARKPVYYVGSVIFAALIYLFFKVLLKIPLPAVFF